MTVNKNEAGILLPQAFTFNASNQQVRTVLLNGEPYFCGKDVCMCLGLSNHNDALAALDDDERRGSPVPTPSGTQQMVVVNESGLYHLIFQSRKEEAKAFRKWVTSEVLPALRRTGRYEVLPIRRSLRHPRRGEPITAEILHLLWLIGESLHQGDQIEIAMELGVTRQTVSRVLNGGQRSSRILMALYKRAQATAKQTVCTTLRARWHSVFWARMFLCRHPGDFRRYILTAVAGLPWEIRTPANTNPIVKPSNK